MGFDGWSNHSMRMVDLTLLDHEANREGSRSAQWVICRGIHKISPSRRGTHDKLGQKQVSLSQGWVRRSIQRISQKQLMQNQEEHP